MKGCPRFLSPKTKCENRSSPDFDASPIDKGGTPDKCLILFRTAIREGLYILQLEGEYGTGGAMDG